MKYDFILFENTRNTDNHYKDLVLFSRMLKDCGYSVAIVNLFKEECMCVTPDIPHIFPKTKCDDSLKQLFHSKTPVHKLLHIYKIEKYLNHVFNEIKDLSDNFYLGSLFLDFPVEFAWKLPNDKKYFIWGLRSTVMNPKRYNFFTLSHHLCLRLKNFLLQTKNVFLVISDELIAEEFVDYGIERKRIIIRPERTTKEIIPVKKREVGTRLNLLSIGTLRAQKKVYKCIDALAMLQDPDITYIIAGKSKLKSLDDIIEKKSENVPNIVRKNYRIPDEEYKQLMANCDYFMICDESKGITITSGTMNEALLAGRPIIAPNEQPFSYYIKKYNVGILYDFHNTKSLAEAILKAQTTDFATYSIPMINYQKTLMYGNVLKRLKETIEPLINSNTI